MSKLLKHLIYAHDPILMDLSEQNWLCVQVKEHWGSPLCRHMNCTVHLRPENRILQAIKFYTPKPGRNSPSHHCHILLLPNQGREWQIYHTRRVSCCIESEAREAAVHSTIHGKAPQQSQPAQILTAPSLRSLPFSVRTFYPQMGLILQVNCTMVPSFLKSNIPIIHLQLLSLIMLDSHFNGYFGCNTFSQALVLALFSFHSTAWHLYS